MLSSSQPLSGLRLLLTRPDDQVADWRHELQRQGASLRHVPVLAIEPVPAKSQSDTAEALRATLGAAQRYDLGIFVSSNAVRYAHAWFHELQLPVPVNMPCFAVGDKTAGKLRELGFNVQPASVYDSESLLRVPRLNAIQGQRLVIFRGRGGRELITQVLRERGAEVSHAELYQRRCPTENCPQLMDAVTQWRPHVVSATSAASVLNLASMADAVGVLDRLQEIPLLVPGARVAAEAQAIGFARLLTARSIRMTDVSYALLHWWRSEGSRSA